MSLENAATGFAGAESAQPARSYQRQDNPRSTSYPVPPPLPSMASLLSRIENKGPIPHHHQQTHQPPFRSFQPQSLEAKHPLYLGEMNPSAPVQHVYHASPESVPGPCYRPEPVLVPVKPGNGPVGGAERVPVPPLALRRQSKRISQRRDVRTTDYVGVNKFFTAGRGSSHEPDRPSESRPPDLSPCATEEEDNPSSEPLTDWDTSPRSTPSAAGPISHFPSGRSRGIQPSTIRYNMTVRQQPIAARACGFGERDRRVIDPPPILQLAIEDPQATPGEISARLRQPYLVVHCTLWDPATDEDASTMPGSTDKRQQRRLMGTLVSAPFVGRDEFNIEGCFFTFPDLSVRTPGKYSLKFSLVVLDPTMFGRPGSAPINAVVKSKPFQVFNAKDFGGMRASTELTKRLKHQGCLISVKKGNAKNNNARDEEEEEDEDEDEDDEGQDNTTKGPATKRRK